MEEEIYTPFENCGWKSAEDGTCSHPNNATPECHQFICPIKAAQHSVQPTLLTEREFEITCQNCGSVVGHAIGKTQSG